MRLWSRVILAGFLSGLAEVLWITLYYLFSHGSSVDVAQAITATLMPSLANVFYAPLLGLLIHFSLSMLLVFMFAQLLWIPFARSSKLATIVLSLLYLSVIWGINFLIILPHLNIFFVVVMPYAITLTSKLLFGISMGIVFSWNAANETKFNNDLRFVR